MDTSRRRRGAFMSAIYARSAGLDGRRLRPWFGAERTQNSINSPLEIEIVEPRRVDQRAHDEWTLP